MPRGAPPAWSARDCTWDHLVAAAIRAGPGEALIYHGIADPGRAAEIRKGIYRCAQHRKVSVQVTWPFNGEMTSKTTMWPPDKGKDGYALTFQVFGKASGRKHVITTMGTDRTNWHYNPRQRAQKEEPS